MVETVLKKTNLSVYLNVSHMMYLALKDFGLPVTRKLTQ